MKKGILKTLKGIGEAAFWTSLYFLPEILDVTVSDHTFVGGLAGSVAFRVGYGYIKNQYIKDELPSGLSKYLDKMPNFLTGTKDAKTTK